MRHPTDTEWLLIVLAAIYLAECLCWLRREAVCFSSLLGTYRPLRSPPFMGNEDKGLVFTNPWPAALCFVCECWPMAIAPDGICLADLGPRPSSGNRVAPGRYIAFSAMRSIQRYDCQVYVNDRLVGKSASAEHARQLARMLKELQSVPEDERPQAVEQRLRQSTATEAVAVRLALLRHKSRRLRIAATMLFLYTFACGPLLYYAVPASPGLVWVYLAGFILCWAWTLLGESSLRRQLLEQPLGKRLQHLGMHMLSPASAMRSGETLLRNSLASYHPVAVAAVLCPRTTAAALARRTLLELYYPRPADAPGEPAARRVDDWFRSRLAECLEEALGRIGIDAAAETRPPMPLEDARSYCPRCHNQYVIAHGDCQPCGGVLLEPFAMLSRLEIAPAVEGATIDCRKSHPARGGP